MFSVGIGPSSSHTVGPMRAALDFAALLDERDLLGDVRRISCTLYGSLGATGIGHGTPDAIIAGLAGLHPETCDPDAVHGAWSTLPRAGAGDAEITLGGTHVIAVTRDDVTFAPFTRLPAHPNAMTLQAWGEDTFPVAEETYYSIGGGFIRREGAGDDIRPDAGEQPLPFSSADAMLALCDERGISIAQLARLNEEAVHPGAVDTGLDTIWAAMMECVRVGLTTDGVLPGGLGVTRRAAAIRGKLEEYDRQRRARPRHVDRVASGVRTRGQRAERLGRSSRDRSDERGGRHHPGRRSLLPALHPRRIARGHPRLPAHRDGGRVHRQGQRVHLGRGGRLPG